MFFLLAVIIWFVFCAQLSWGMNGITEYVRTQDIDLLSKAMGHLATTVVSGFGLLLMVIYETRQTPKVGNGEKRTSGEISNSGNNDL